jgi:hypothetical protein
VVETYDSYDFGNSYDSYDNSYGGGNNKGHKKVFPNHRHEHEHWVHTDDKPVHKHYPPHRGAATALGVGPAVIAIAGGLAVAAGW